MIFTTGELHNFNTLVHAIGNPGLLLNSNQVSERGLVIKLPITDAVKGEREKLEPHTGVEFILEFHPGETKKRSKKPSISVSVDMSNAVLGLKCDKQLYSL